MRLTDWAWRRGRRRPRQLTRPFPGHHFPRSAVTIPDWQGYAELAKVTGSRIVRSFVRQFFARTVIKTKLTFKTTENRCCGNDHRDLPDSSSIRTLISILLPHHDSFCELRYKVHVGCPRTTTQSAAKHAFMQIISSRISYL